ncbi:MAG: SDR family NAD(P)-dependent oxidoreductase [Pseudomonadota bacterium]
MSAKVLLITGGATGIGAAVARLASEEGIQVAICDMNEDAGTALADELGGRFFHCDVTNLVSVRAAVEACEATLGVPDYAHLNAGIMTVPTNHPYLPIEDVSEDQYRRIVGVNLDGVVFGTQTLIPKMRGAGGAITLTASTAGLSAVPVDPMYTSTKYAVIGFGRAVAGANENSNIRINVICPGVTDTQIVPDNFRAPEFNMMPAQLIATEVLDLLHTGRNGEVRVKVDADTPAFASETPELRS